MSETARQEQLDAWRAVAHGWDRRRDVVWESTRPVSERLVELLALQPGERLLETAAGPGDTGFLALGRLAPGGRLVSTDGVAEMVDSARARAEELALEDVEFAVADAVDLPFDDDSFDAAVCRFGVMLVPDHALAARELARVVRPDGRVAVAVWAESARNPWIGAVGRSAVELGLAERPDPDAPGPFRLGAPGRLRAVLEQAGLVVEVDEEVEVVWQADSLAHWWEITHDTSRGLAVLAERHPPETLARIRDVAERALAGFVTPAGEVRVPGVARVALARRR